MQECANSISQRAWSRPIISSQTPSNGREKKFVSMNTGVDDEDDVDCWRRFGYSMRVQGIKRYFKMKSN